MKKIVLTGGGTAGHVTPNIALLPSLKEAGYEVFYIGSYTGIEKTLIEDLGIPYYGISSGKLRRYRSLKNLSDPFRVLHGLFQAKRLMKKIKPDIVFSKGGFSSAQRRREKASCSRTSLVKRFCAATRSLSLIPNRANASEAPLSGLAVPPVGPSRSNFIRHSRSAACGSTLWGATPAALKSRAAFAQCSLAGAVLLPHLPGVRSLS